MQNLNAKKVKVILPYGLSPTVSDQLTTLLKTFINEPWFFADQMEGEQDNKNLHYIFEGASIAQKTIFNSLVWLNSITEPLNFKNVKRVALGSKAAKKYGFLIGQELKKINPIAYGANGCFLVDHDYLGATQKAKKTIKVLCQYRSLDDLVEFYKKEFDNE